MRFKTFITMCSASGFLLLGIFIVASTSIIRGAEIEGTNPLSRKLQQSKSNSSSSPPHFHSKSKSNTATSAKEVTLMQNISEKINNAEISHSNHNQTGGKVAHRQSRRIGKRRQFKIKQLSSHQLQPKSEPRPFLGDLTTNKNVREKRLRKNMKEQTLNFDKGLEAESLRMKILSQLGSVDPLLCLPKALCGLASNVQLQEKIRVQTLTGTKTKEILNNGIDSTFQNNDSQANKPSPDDWVNNYIDLMKTVVLKNDDGTRSKVKSKVRVRDNDLDSSSSEESKEDEWSNSDETLSQDDLDHFKEKARIEKWMKDDDYDPDPNWWDIFPRDEPYRPIDEGPQPNSPQEENGLTWSTYRISKGLSSFFTSMLPQVSFGFGKAPDVFADDPWFSDYRRRSLGGRSLSDGSSRSFSWLFGKGDALGKESNLTNKRKRMGRGSGTMKSKKKAKNKGKNMNRTNRRRHLSDGEFKLIDDDPMEKFQLAVEIGKQIDPKQCEYVFTGCPFTYLEIIEIIESSKKEAVQGNQVPSQENELDLGLLGLINNATSTISHDLPTGDRLEISLKIADKAQGTMVPLSAILQNPDEHPTTLTMVAPPSHPEKHFPFPPPLTSEQNNDYKSPVTSSPVDLSPSHLFRTALSDIDQTQDNGGEDDSFENSVKPPKTLKPKPSPPKNKRHKLKGIPPHRKQWGAQHHLPPTHISPVVVQIEPQRPLPSPPLPTPTIHRQQFHTHTKYKHIPMPTTINKPSHVINYHFHNTNSHPQVTHSGGVGSKPPTQMTVHSYPPTPHPTTPTVATTPTPTTTTSTPAPLRFRDDFKPQKRQNKRRRRRYKSPSKKIKPRRKKIIKLEPSKRSSEERIVIRLPETTQPPNNNYYNLYPLLSSLYHPTPQPQSQPVPQGLMYQSQPQSYPIQQYHGNHHHQFQHHSPQPQPYFVSSQSAHHGLQPHHQSHPYYPHSPLVTPGIFSYILGKKK